MERRRGLIRTARNAALFAALFAAGCGEKGTDHSVGDEGDALPVQETKVRKWVEYDGGKMTWEFRGDVLRYFEKPERVESDGVVVDFYDEEENYSSTLTAVYGEIDRSTSDMLARGDVVLRNRDGVRLETDWVRWSNDEDRITTDAFVTIVRGKRRITGYGLRADPGLEETEILRDVVAFTVEGSGEE